MIKQIKLLCSALLAVSLISQPAHAALITLSPSSQTVELGDTASVNVSISDLAADDYLGVFDFELVFNNSLLVFNSLTFGSELGFSTQFFDVNAGFLEVFESSLETPEFLEDNQARDFLLFTISFNTLGYGTSDIDISTIFSLGDQFGNEITDINWASASISVLNPNAVPEPVPLALIMFGLAWLARRKTR